MSRRFLGKESPRLPARRRVVGTAVALTGLVHLLGAMLLISLAAERKIPPDLASTSPVVMRVVLPRLVFRLSEPASGGGGGGGNRQRGPIRHAERVGRDAVSLPTRKPPATADRVTADAMPPGMLLLDARPLASGHADQIGLLIGGVSDGTSTGPGSGGGAGTGVGTGIGSGRGPGIGAGSGGGAGGGVYRPGGKVTAPRILSQIKPRYTYEALRDKIQGSVWLELVVTREGRVDHIRIVRSLDSGGLDQEAVTAVRDWRFEPGRLGDTPVDVLVTVAMDFTIR